MQVNATQIHPQVNQGQVQRYLSEVKKDSSEKFQASLRGFNSTPASAGPQTAPPASAPKSRTIPAAFKNQTLPSLPGASSTGDSAKTLTPPSSTAPSSGASVSAPTGSGEGSSHLSTGQAGDIWYGGANGGASVDGVYSEKASVGGNPGLGHYNYATVSTGEDMVVSVTGLHGKNPAPTQVMALDADAILKANNGIWPSTPQELQNILLKNPQCIVANVQATPPQMTRISGVPKGTRVVVLTGAEAIMGNPPKSPPGSQAMVTNLSQLSAKAQALVPKDSIMAGGTQAMMKAQAELMARQQAQKMADDMARNAAQRIATQTAARVANEGVAQAGAQQAQARTLGAPPAGNSERPDMGASNTRGGKPPVKVHGMKRGAPGQPTVSLEELEAQRLASMGKA